MRKVRSFLSFAVSLAVVGLLALLASSALGASSGPTTLYLPAIAGPAAVTPTPTQIAQVVPASGLWLGSDKKGPRPPTLTIQFEVSADHTQVDYFLMKFTVEGCTGTYEIKVSGAPIENGRFNINALNQTFRAGGVFDTNRTASGTVEFSRYFIEDCNGKNLILSGSEKWTGFYKGPGAPVP